MEIKKWYRDLIDELEDETIPDEAVCFTGKLTYGDVREMVDMGCRRTDDTSDDRKAHMLWMCEQALIPENLKFTVKRWRIGGVLTGQPYTDGIYGGVEEHG